MAKAKILIVDDETKWAERGFLEELKLSGFRFEHKTDIDEAVAYLNENLNSIDVLILDIMMPPGKNFEGTSDQGFDTGIEFYERFRPLAPDLPVLIFTNVPGKEVAQKFLSEKNCWFFQKIDLLPFELVEEIEEILADQS